MISLVTVFALWLAVGLVVGYLFGTMVKTFSGEEE